MLTLSVRRQDVHPDWVICFFPKSTEVFYKMFWNLARPTLCPDYSTLYYIIPRCMRWDSHAMQVSLNTRTSEMLNHHQHVTAQWNAAIFEFVRDIDHIWFPQKFHDDISNGSRITALTNMHIHRPTTRHYWKQYHLAMLCKKQVIQQEVKVIWQKAPHGGPIPG